MGITDTAIERLRGLIVSGDLTPGARLPPETELAAQLGISRGSVREAVKALTHARMLAVRQGDGTYVTSLEPDELLQGITLAAELARNETVLDVVEVRRLLEPGATRLAAERISERELHELAELLHAMDGTEEPEAFVRLDVEFHNRVAEASGNAWLSAILRGLAEPTIRARRERLTVDHAVSATTRRQHREIYEALKERDGALAQASALAHVCSTQRGVRAVLGTAATD
jgi:GntR family transcriptional regulator, transcriptional repressor for pyruvate dehydrogenase complex